MLRGKEVSKLERLLQKEADPAFARRARIIFKSLDLRGDEKVLDAGCGRGFYVKVLKTIWPNLKIFGVDIDNRYLLQAKRISRGLNVKFLKSSVLHLPFRDAFFDRIIASEILEHIEDDEKAISEIYRVLKPGGLVIVTVPNKNYPFLWDPLNWILERVFGFHVPSNIWWLAGIWADHIRLYDGDLLTNKLIKAGFRIRKVIKTTYFCFPFSHFILYGLGKNLVELGLMKDFDRFSFGDTEDTSSLSKILLMPIKLIDRLNEGKNFNYSSVNIIVKAAK